MKNRRQFAAKLIFNKIKNGYKNVQRLTGE